MLRQMSVSGEGMRVIDVRLKRGEGDKGDGGGSEGGSE